MDRKWSVPVAIRKRFPFEAATAESLFLTAEASHPFSGDEVLKRLRGPLLDLLYAAKLPCCEEAHCSLFRSDIYFDTEPKTGELIPRIVPGYGGSNAKIMFVGEGPGSGERNSYTPLVGAEQVLASKCPDCIHFTECYRTLLR